MSYFKGWKPKGQDGLFIRFYFVENNVFLGKQGRKWVLGGGSIEDIAKAANVLDEHGIDYEAMSSSDINAAMEQKGLLVQPGRRPKQRHVPSFAMVREEISEGYGNIKTGRELALEASMLDLGKPPFKASTLKNCFVTVDTREPKQLLSLMKRSRIDEAQISAGALVNGDILFCDRRDDSRLLIERKTVTDFYSSIVNNHAHDQAERCFDEAREHMESGKRMKVVWIIEGQEGGERLLYNALPEVKNMDGMISYLSGILDQQVCQSYCMEHTVNLALKFAQCFFERELFYKLEVKDAIANRKGKDRSSVSKPDLMTGEDGHGAVRASDGPAAILSRFPSIKSNVAKELVGTGRCIREITQMSEDELANIKGVSRKSAARIFAEFNGLL